MKFDPTFISSALNAFSKLTETAGKKIPDSGSSAIKDKVKNGKSKLKKRVLNVGGTAGIITTALTMMYNSGEVTWEGIGLLVIGVIYAFGMEYFTSKNAQNS